MGKNKGFTVLELLITLTIIAIVAALGTPAFTDRSIKKNFRNHVDQVIVSLKEARIYALSENTTTRIVLSGSAGSYNMTAYTADTPTSSCTSGAATWTEKFNRDLDLTSRFEITGTGVGNVCFFRDSSSKTESNASANYTFAQVDGGSEYGSATIDVIMATGFIDATVD